ncbi:hypothetical protein CEUSTIGMA_g2538.t1 [Chlamydomonas eustigma]|uniref:H/ACA ribonucleoprotein complex non-core subunit NAF1 n=1 Tax=Chlamydomonas eustigma TaxID=1157962 RepID=A0A250WW81_9CHLO|nr:hypothetical protein CEUSTIGMA_g2538.t1 [Chlamydomonas eustigma]|eukprot:GAX75094.1 hypothetical protein CEUSTIGMA_g2538.t1 [Chlamydomonas eustigma]
MDLAYAASASGVGASDVAQISAQILSASHSDLRGNNKRSYTVKPPLANADMDEGMMMDDFYGEVVGLPSVNDLDVAAAAAAAALEVLAPPSNDSSEEEEDSDEDDSSDEDTESSSSEREDEEMVEEYSLNRSLNGDKIQQEAVVAKIDVKSDGNVALTVIVQKGIQAAMMKSGSSPVRRDGMECEPDSSPLSSVVSSSSSDEDSSESDIEEMDMDQMKELIDKAYAEHDEEDAEDAKTFAAPHKELGLSEAPEPLDEVQALDGEMLDPAGSVMSLFEGMVVVQGPANSRALSEGSVIFLDDRTPVGRVEEVFGPIMMPLYAFRYAGKGRPPAALHEGAAVYSVPRLRTFLLQDDVYKYSKVAADVEDVEAAAEEEVYFSDDEQEESYQRTMKAKRKAEGESSVFFSSSDMKGNRVVDRRNQHARGGDRGQRERRSGPPSSGFQAHATATQMSAVLGLNGRGGGDSRGRGGRAAGGRGSNRADMPRDSVGRHGRQQQQQQPRHHHASMHDREAVAEPPVAEMAYGASHNGGSWATLQTPAIQFTEPGSFGSQYLVQGAASPRGAVMEAHYSAGQQYRQPPPTSSRPHYVPPAPPHFSSTNSHSGHQGGHPPPHSLNRHQPPPHPSYPHHTEVPPAAAGYINQRQHQNPPYHQMSQMSSGHHQKVVMPLAPAAPPAVGGGRVTILPQQAPPYCSQQQQRQQQWYGAPGSETHHSHFPPPAGQHPSVPSQDSRYNAEQRHYPDIYSSASYQHNPHNG